MLITCPECERQISDQANSCPGCGFPIWSFILNERIKSQQQEHIEKFLDKHHLDSYYVRLCSSESDDGLSPLGKRLYTAEIYYDLAKVEAEDAIIRGLKSAPQKNERYKKKKAFLEETIQILESGADC